MAFSKRAVVFLASAFLLPSFAFASGFVGNGGDGVEIGGKLYLHDLAEAGLHRDPYVGNKISPSIPAWPRALDSLKLSHEPLLRKLSDLDQSYPGFADYLVATIKLYTWSLEEFELTPIPDPEGPVKYPPGTKFYQIANRSKMAIRIHRPSWDRLDENNKAALVLHEVIYSLVRPVPNRQGDWIQPASTARFITAQVFTKGFLEKQASVISAELAVSLGLPDAPIPKRELRSPRVLHNQFFAKPGGPLRARGELRLARDLSPEELGAWARKVCEVGKRLSHADRDQDLELIIGLEHPHVRRQVFPYRFRDSAGSHTQFAVSFIPLSFEGALETLTRVNGPALSDAEFCREQLLEIELPTGLIW